MNEDDNDLLSIGVLSYADNESVCGSDTRYKVAETDTVPYYYACYLRIIFPQGTFVGSACFFHDNSISTINLRKNDQSSGSGCRQIMVV